MTQGKSHQSPLTSERQGRWPGTLTFGVARDRFTHVVDAALIVTGVIVWVTGQIDAGVHFLFGILAVGAFLMPLRRFAIRWGICTVVAVAETVGDAAGGHFHTGSLIEIPVLMGLAALVSYVETRRVAGKVDQLEAKESLEVLMSRYEQLVAAVPAVVYTAEIGKDGTWLFANDSASEILGVEPKRLKQAGDIWFELIHPADRDRVLVDEIETVESQRPLDSEYRVRRPDGSTIWVRDQAKLVTLKGRERPAMHGVITDITPLKLAQQAAESRAVQQAVVAELGRLAVERDLSALMQAAVDLIARTLDVAFCQIFEVTNHGENLVLRAGYGWEETLMGEARVEAGLRSQMGYTLLCETPVIVDDLAGESRFTPSALLRDHGVVSGLSVVINEGGRPYGVLGAHSTQRRTFSQQDADFLLSVANVLSAALRLANLDAKASFEQKRFVAAFDAALSGTALIGPDGRFLTVNDALCRMLGRQRSELLRLNVIGVTHPDDIANLIGTISHIVAGTTGAASLPARFQHRGGTTVYAEVGLSPVKDSDGNVLYLLLQSNDVSDKVRAENERDRFFEASTDLLVVTDVEGRFMHLNPAWEEVLGYSSAELKGKRIADFVHPDDRGLSSAIGASLRSEESTKEFRNRFVAKDGRIVDLEWRAVLVKDDQLIYASARDVTRHRELEDQLRHSQKMEAIGRLAGGVAHDFNNILGIILNYTEFISEEVGSDNEDLKADLDELRAATDRGAQLVRQLLTFSKRDVAQPEPLCINQSIEIARSFLRRALGEDIELKVDLEDGLWRTTIDPGHVDQILLNLAVNARDAMPTGGSLVVETRNAEIDETFAQLHSGIEPGEHVLLAVSDEGIGMSEAVRDRIFEPFYTTKEHHGGTGLGLATIYGIVHEAGGHISVYSEEGVGTTFRIYLPRSPEDARPEVEDDRPAEETTGRGEFVLVAEDDPALRSIIRRVLETSGYEAEVASSATEALEIYKEHPEKVSVLLTDVVMPDMTGKELSDLVSEAGNGVKTVFMSGYTDDIIAARGALPNGASFIQKPFTSQALLDGLRKVLN